MKTSFKKLFRVLFFLISAILFLFVFFPERCLSKKGKRTEKIVQKKRQNILKKRVYYAKEYDSEEVVEE